MNYCQSNRIFLYRAQEFHMRNLFAIYGGKLCGLLAVLAVPSILKILICTNASSTPYTAYKRYMATIFHTLCWYEEEMKPGSRYVITQKSLQIIDRKKNSRIAIFDTNICHLDSSFGFVFFFFWSMVPN